MTSSFRDVKGKYYAINPFTNYTGLTIRLSVGNKHMLMHPGERTIVGVENRKESKNVYIEGIGSFKDGTIIKKQKIPYPDYTCEIYLTIEDCYIDGKNNNVKPQIVYTDIIDKDTPLIGPESYEPTIVKYNVRYKSSGSLIKEISQKPVEFSRTKHVTFNPKVEYFNIKSRNKAKNSPRSTFLKWFAPNTGEAPYYKPLLFNVIAVNRLDDETVDSCNKTIGITIIFMLMFLIVAIIAIYMFRFVSIRSEDREYSRGVDTYA